MRDSAAVSVYAKYVSMAHQYGQSHRGRVNKPERAPSDSASVCKHWVNKYKWVISGVSSSSRIPLARLIAPAHREL